MNKRWVAFLLLLSACSQVPVTGRKSFNIVSESEEKSLGVSAYKQVLKESKLSQNAAAIAQVKRVGQRIAKISDRPDFEWEFAVIDDPKTQNAFCLPGGKVAVYTGLLPVTKTDAGLAVVLGHEIGHAIARHGAERMSQALLVNLGEESLAVAMRNKPAETQKTVMQAFGLGAQVGALLPFSRAQELEADRIGLLYMAKAGYDPQEAVAFWQRMNAASQGGEPPEFLSTHPSHGTRISDIQKWMPEALPAYQNSPYR